MAKERTDLPQPSKPGPTIPAGTEQETGLSRGITETPEKPSDDEDSEGQMNDEEQD
jgi:hypothetical protein